MGVTRHLKYELRAYNSETEKFELFYSSYTPLEQYKLVDPILNLEESASGSLEMSIPQTNIKYGDIQLMISTIRAYIDGQPVWEGRPIKFDEDMWLNHKIICEGALSYTNDVYQPAAKYTSTRPEKFMEHVITNYNAKAKFERRFIFGTVSIDADYGSGYTEDFETNYESTLNIINSFCEKFGCIPVVSINITGKLVIDFINKTSRLGENSTQRVEFGKNLINFTKGYDFSSMVTAILPLGKKVESTGNGSIVKGKTKSTVSGGTHVACVLQRDYPVGSPPSNPYRTITENYLNGLVESNKITQEAANYIWSNRYNFSVCEYSVKGGDTVFISTRVNNGFGIVVSRDSSTGTLYYDPIFSKNSSIFTVKADYKYKVNQSIGDDGRLYVGWFAGDSDASTASNGFEVAEGIPKDEYQDEYCNIIDYSEGVSGGYDPDTGEPITIYDEYYTESGSGYIIDRDGLETYGWIEQKIEFSEEESIPNLFLKGKRYLSSDKFDGMQIEVTAMDLRALGYFDATNLAVSQYIKVYAPIYGLIGENGDGLLMPITKLSIPFDNPDDMKYTIGYTSVTSLTASNAATNATLIEAISKQATFSETVEAAKTNAVKKIVDTNSSYITIKYDGTGANKKATAIIISKTQNYLDAPDGYWEWSAGGLGWVPRNSSKTVAMTDDGQIVADFITTGTMAADRIMGGTLKLGHWSGVDGDIQMKDSSGNFILKINRTDGIITENPSDHYKAVMKGGGVYFVNPNDASGGTTFAPSITNQIFTDGQGNPLYRCLSLYGQRIGFSCNNFWVFSNGSWYATDEGVRTVTIDGKKLTFVNGILKDVESV